MMRTFVVCVFLLALTAPVTSSASLIIDIFGVAGHGETTWVFSGSTLSTGYSDESSIGWGGVGDYLVAASGPIHATLGTATVTSPLGGTTAFEWVTLRNRPGRKDNLKIAVGDYLIGTGVVSWAGTLLLPLDMNEFNVGVYGPADGASADLTDIRLTVHAPSVPVPNTLILVGLLALGMVVARKTAG